MANIDRRVASHALISAAAIWVAGFGTLTSFYLTIPRQPHLPGLFDFASATWGDGLALPIMTAALVYAVLMLPRARRERTVTAISALAGGATGAGTQVQWLRDEAPRLNWTFPRAHHFNVAGTYHAVFLVAMCTLTTALWLLVVLRLAQVTHIERQVIRAVMIAAGSGALFVALLTLDGRSAAATRAGDATAVATVAGVMLLLTALVSTALIRWRRTRRHPPTPRRRPGSDRHPPRP